jgi:hypothetical protein
MHDMATTIDRYVAVWNEPDPEARRREIEALWRPDALFANAGAEYRGHSEIAAGVTLSHDRWVGTGHVFRSAGLADAHHNVARVVWAMHAPSGGEPVSIGTSFLTFDADGRIVSDHQFIDQ